jgi:hypothetical protein
MKDDEYMGKSSNDIPSSTFVSIVEATFVYKQVVRGHSVEHAISASALSNLYNIATCSSDLAQRPCSYCLLRSPHFRCRSVTHPKLRHSRYQHHPLFQHPCQP